MTTKLCPYCFSDTGIRTILYGLPMEEPDPAIYTIGGCCISEDMPKYECIECGWEGKKIQYKTPSRIATGDPNKD
jgi:hypothetical protein